MRSRDGQVDNKAADPPTNTQLQNAPVDTTLPPRVVVELPDGGVQIGEDSQRLQHEHVQLSIAANRNGSSHRAGAQPGTEQWLELRRLLYATALEAISIKRKRVCSLLVAIDLLYMLLTIAAAFISSTNREHLGDWLPPSQQNIRLIVAVLGALLDMVTLALVMRERRKATRVMAVFHLCLLLPAMIHELLGMHLAGLRQDYMNAMERMDRVRASQQESAGDDSMESGVVWSMQLAPVRPPRAIEPTLAESTAAAAISQRSRQHSSESQAAVEEITRGEASDRSDSATASSHTPNAGMASNEVPSNSSAQRVVEAPTGAEGSPVGESASQEIDSDAQSTVIAEPIAPVGTVALTLPPTTQQ